MDAGISVPITWVEGYSLETSIAHAPLPVPMSTMREGDEDNGTRMFLLLNKSRKRVCTRWRCSSEATGYSSWERDEGICGDVEFDDGNFCECEESRLSPFMYFCLNADNCLGVIQSVAFSVEGIVRN